MAANGNSGNGNTGTATSASQAQSQAAAGNAAASNAANGNTGTGNTSTSNSSTSTNTSNTSGESSGKGSTSNTATNSAGLMSSLIGFGNAVAKGEVGNGSGGSSDGNLNAGPADTADKSNVTLAALRHAIHSERTGIPARSELPANAVAKGDEAYTKARAEGKTEAEAQRAARDAVRGELNSTNQMNTFNKLSVYAFKAENTGPTYNPAVTQRANTNKTIAAGSSKMGPSAPAASITPSAPSNTAGPAAGSTGTEGASAAPSTSDATNTGITNRGGTVANGGGTAVTDSGTGGSVSSSITPPSRDASSIGLGVYNTDRANYDQDNWNRGMEAESSSLVSDEECKAFAKRAFLENSEPFKKVRLTIVKKC